MATRMVLPESLDKRNDDPVFALHRGGKMQIAKTVALHDRVDLALAYTPGVARVCEAIASEPALVDDYTWIGNTVAVVTDGTAVLGLGDIGPRAAMPVMEERRCCSNNSGESMRSRSAWIVRTSMS
jgi:malate dehydrogenase (oxaloacetate-decarboxylating)